MNESYCHIVIKAINSLILVHLSYTDLRMVKFSIHPEFQFIDGHKPNNDERYLKAAVNNMAAQLNKHHHKHTNQRSLCDKFHLSVKSTFVAFVNSPSSSSNIQIDSFSTSLRQVFKTAPFHCPKPYFRPLYAPLTVNRLAERHIPIKAALYQELSESLNTELCFTRPPNSQTSPRP